MIHPAYILIKFSGFIHYKDSLAPGHRNKQSNTVTRVKLKIHTFVVELSVDIEFKLLLKPVFAFAEDRTVQGRYLIFDGGNNLNHTSAIAQFNFYLSYRGYFSG